ncbi:MAG TPA: hypothetical protein DDW98_10420, partial [Gammaproteobacteria bacterium]|nr:hypothetical protein [Gammaproteobacteria bacterium]
MNSLESPFGIRGRDEPHMPLRRLRSAVAWVLATACIVWLGRGDLTHTGFLYPALLAWVAFALAGDEAIGRSSL